MTQNYKIFNIDKIDKNKKNILFFLHENSLSLKSYTITYQYIFNLMRIFSGDFNIIIVSKGFSTKAYEYYSQDVFYEDEFSHFHNYVYISFDVNSEYANGKRAAEFSHNQRGQVIQKDLLELDKNDKWIFDNLAGCIHSQCLISANGYDYEDVNINAEEKINKSILKYNDSIKNDTLVGHAAFMQQPLGYTTNLMFYIMKNYPKVFHYHFLHDTAVAWLHGIPQYNMYTQKVKTYYFVDDFRNARSFHKFPIAELQEFYDIGLPKISVENKTKDFLFGGLFPFGIQHRIDSWETYFKNLKCNGSIRTQTNGKPKVKSDSIVASTQVKISKKDLKNKEFIDSFINEVLSHSMVLPTVEYTLYNKELSDSLFTIILKCYYGKTDMVNFRFISSLANGTIPLIAQNYDTGHLQIPTQYRKFLEVKNHDDILDKIQWARDNPQEYKNLFDELYNTFIVKKYFDKDYYNTEFKREFFSDLYK